MSRGSGRFPVFYCRAVLSVAFVLSWAAGTAAGALELEMIHKLTPRDTTGATIADWNKDGVLDVIISGVGSGGGSLTILYSLGPELLQLPVNVSGSHIGTVPALADMNNDGKLETVFGNDEGYVTAFDVDRQVIWQHGASGRVRSSPVVADLDGDGGLEVVFGNSDGEVIAIKGSDGKKVWKSERASPITSSPAVADLDEDGDIDVLVGSEDGRLHALEGKTGILLWQLSTGGAIQSSPAVGDLDSDGQLEVVVGSNDGFVYVVDGRSGKREWRQSVGTGLRKEVASPVTIADLDNDGRPDIVVGINDGTVHAYSGTGKEMWEADIGGRITSSLLVADLDGDRSMEVLAVSALNRESTAYLLSGKWRPGGQVLWKHEFRGEIHSHPALADLERDGKMEVIIGPYIFRSSGSGEVRWGKFAGDSSNTGLLKNALEYAADPLVYPYKGPEAISIPPVRHPKRVWKIDKMLPNSANFADMDGDGALDIVGVAEVGIFRRTKEKIVITYGDTHESKEYKVKGNISGMPAVGRIINDDDWLDVVVACDNGKVYAFDGLIGEMAWEYEAGGGIEASPALVDVNGDHLMDVVTGSNDKYIHVIDGKTGGLLWKCQTKDKIRLTVAVGDLDGDGILDLAVADDAAFVYGIDTQMKNIKWSFPTAGSLTCSPSIADMDGDNLEDVVIGANDGSVYAINGLTGAQLWRKSVLYLPVSTISIADVNDDDTPEVFVGLAGADTKVLYAIDGGSGLEIWRQSVETTIETAPVVADIDGDGSPEIAVGGNNYVYAIDGTTGQQKYRYQIGKGNFLCSAVLDIDGDGLLDIAAADLDSGSLDVLSTSSKGEVLWAKMYGDCYNTGGLNAALGYARAPVSYPRVLPVAPPPDEEPPEILVEYPSDGMEIDGDEVHIRGYVTDNKVVCDIRINDKNFLAGAARVTLDEVVQLKPGENTIRIEAWDPTGNEKEKTLVVYKLRPTLSIVCQIEQAGMPMPPGGGIKPDETVTLVVAVRNNGRGTARNVKAELLHSGDDGDKGMRVQRGIEIQPPSVPLGDIPPQDSSECSFTFSVPSTYAERSPRTRRPEIGFQIKLSDELGHEAIERIELQVKRLAIGPPSIAIESPTEGLERWALLIGINEYLDKDINPLRFAVADVLALKELLVDPLRVGFKPEKVKVLINDEATKANILRDLTGRLTMSNKDDIVLIYYSGHGVNHKEESYLLPVETDLSIIPAYAIRNKDFVEAVDGIKASKVVTILDCCHSGGVSVDVKAIGETPDGSFYKPFKESRGKVILASCGIGEQSYEWEEKGHGVFTYHLMEGIRGAADENGDGIVMFLELRKYAEDKVSDWARRRGREQKPELQSSHLAGEIPLSVNVIKVYRFKVMRFFRERRLPAPAMDRALDLLEKYGAGELSTEEQSGLELLIEVLKGRMRPERFELWMKAR